MNEKTAYDFIVKNKKGEDISLADYRGRVMLIVNTASKCGFTPQFADLERLWQQYRERGLVVIGFPCNQFAEQDPGTDDEIQEFCQVNFGVTFPLMKKIEVNGPGADPLFQWLQGEQGFAGWDPAHQLTPILEEMLSKADPDYKQKPDIKWNFTKFLIDKAGHVACRFEPTTDFDAIARQIEALL